MKTFTVDFTNVKTYDDFYEAFIKGLKLPDWFGKNSDALWDMLTGYIECPATIYLKGLNKLPQSLSRRKELTIEVFQEAADKYGEIEYILKP